MEREREENISGLLTWQAQIQEEVTRSRCPLGEDRAEMQSRKPEQERTSCLCRCWSLTVQVPEPVQHPRKLWPRGPCTQLQSVLGKTLQLRGAAHERVRPANELDPGDWARLPPSSPQVF